MTPLRWKTVFLCLGSVLASPWSSLNLPLLTSAALLLHNISFSCPCDKGASECHHVCDLTSEVREHSRRFLFSRSLVGWECPYIWICSLGICVLPGFTGVQRQDCKPGHVCRTWWVCVCGGEVGGQVCFCSWLLEKHPAHASAVALARQWHCCLTFRARGQGGASHHLPTKAQVTRLALALPFFLPSPPRFTSSNCWSSWQN